MHPAHVHSIATEVPENVIDETVVRSHMQEWLGDNPEMHAAVIDLMHGTRVKSRRFAFTPRELLADKGLEWMNREYAGRILPLAERACARALEAAQCTAKDIDLILSTSCTGFMIPPLDAHLANRMGFRSDLKRLPITELGCAGGAAALARASDYLRAYPDHKVLVLTAELTSATFQLKDHSKGNLVASMLFGDGIAAAVMGGKPGPKGGPSIAHSASAWFPDTLGLMGFDLKATGFHLILSPRIPAVVKREIKPFMDRLLETNGKTREDLSFFVLHPGGTRVLEALEDTLAIPRADVQHCWDVLANYGNLSSAMVMFILDELWRTKTPKPGSHGVLAAFGPAFGAEASLLGWEAAR
jgi:alkylresorcinol/alkylpyrone synthase